jgi:hypothetical protein
MLRVRRCGCDGTGERSLSLRCRVAVVGLPALLQAILRQQQGQQLLAPEALLQATVFELLCRAAFALGTSRAAVPLAGEGGDSTGSDSRPVPSAVHFPAERGAALHQAALRPVREIKGGGVSTRFSVFRPPEPGSPPPPASSHSGSTITDAHSPLDRRVLQSSVALVLVRSLRVTGGVPRTGCGTGCLEVARRSRGVAGSEGFQPEQGTGGMNACVRALPVRPVG